MPDGFAIVTVTLTSIDVPEPAGAVVSHTEQRWNHERVTHTAEARLGDVGCRMHMLALVRADDRFSRNASIGPAIARATSASSVPAVAGRSLG
jgi:hypothetical protein